MMSAELNSVWRAKYEVEREERRLKDLEALAETTTPILDGMPRSKTLEYKVERLAIRMAECRDAIVRLKETLILTKFDLLNHLQAFHLPELQERVLSYRYVSCMKFNSIARRMNFSYAYISKLHVKGLEALGLSLDDVVQPRIVTRSER